MGNDRGLDMRAVAERFAQSATALDDLTERLQSLASTSESLARAEDNLKGVSSAVSNFIKEISAMSGQLKGATDGLRTATALAERFLTQTDTNAIAASLEELTTLMKSQISQLSTDRDREVHEKEKLQKELNLVRSELDQLKNKVNAIPDKQRKKLNF
jgi:SMC interacting uncharacterized protein involved in chromosome segregation